MNAIVGKSSDISHTLTYFLNPDKDGSILLANHTDLSADPRELAREWEATAKNYRTQCYTVIVSFTPEETKELRSKPDNGRSLARTLIREFLNELSERGNDVADCPYLVVRHDNTDNEHYHIAVRTTDIFGSRFRDKFIKKNANRAAASIALKYGLNAPAKAAQREKAHQEAEGKRQKERAKRLHRPAANLGELNEKMRRKKAAEEARQRKATLKFLIEKAARENMTAQDFHAALAKDGIIIFQDEGKILMAQMTDDNGTERQYSVAKNLGVDMALLNHLNLFPSSNAVAIPSNPVRSVRGRSSSQRMPTKDPGLRNVGGAGNARNAEHEVGTSYSGDDLDEEWKRRNGYKM